jgi:hypothetical protein
VSDSKEAERKSSYRERERKRVREKYIKKRKENLYFSD